MLLLGYNRPDKVRQAIAAIASSAPEVVLFAVDGPKAHIFDDAQRVQETQKAIDSINWNCKIQTRFRESNLGLKSAIVDSVSWAISEFDRVIVIEDDAIPGPQLINYASTMLDYYETDLQVAHVNGYNMVPSKHLERPNDHSRLSRFPESYAWATWGRAWCKYDDSLTWALDTSLKELSAATGSYLGAIRWKQIFNDAASGRIDTWAVRWLATMWSQNWKMVAPNRNITNYSGWNGGTHTIRKPKWTEVPIEFLDFTNFKHQEFIIQRDFGADDWRARAEFGETIFGVCEGVLASGAMEIMRRIKEGRRKVDD